MFVPTNIPLCENPKIPGNLSDFQEENCPQNVILPPGDPPARLFPGMYAIHAAQKKKPFVAFLCKMKMTQES